MNLTNTESIIAITGSIGAFIGYIGTKLIKTTKHEDMQDNIIGNHTEKLERLCSKVDNLEEREKNRDLAIIEIKTEMQHTQTMIQHLGENHQESFLKLIELIEKIDSNRS